MRPCFNFTAVAAAAGGEQSTTLSIFDEIGFWGVQAKDFKAALDAVGSKVLNVEINSPGGDVFAGLAIFNMLRASGKEIVVKVMGVAASAASLIAMAGDKIVMPKNTFMMIHNPWSVAMGNADELRETADTLDKIGNSLLLTYAKKTGLADDELKTMLATDTWLTADEALEKGFATEVVDEIKANAKFDLDRADLPAAIRALFAAPTPAPTPAPVALVPATVVAVAIQAAAVTAGLPQADADFLAVACETEEAAKPRILAAVEMQAIAKIVKADGVSEAIRAGISVADFRAKVIKAMAESDVHTSTTKPAPAPKAEAKTLKPAAENFAAIKKQSTR